MEHLKTALAALPHTPGVYLYQNREGKVLYVGKAIDLARRVRQYFYPGGALGPKTRLLVAQIHDLKTIATISEFDALLLEAKLIRQYEPKYNLIAKDDKSALYIVLTLKEALPRILFLRKTSLTHELGKNRSRVAIFGPFQSARVARSLMRALRRIVPYCTQMQRRGKNCFYSHLGLCSPCPGAIVALTDPGKRRQAIKEYRRNIFRLRDILSGKAVWVLTQLEAQMRGLADRQEYEKATQLRQQVENLHALLVRHYDPNLYVQTDGFIEDTVAEELRQLRQILAPYFPALGELSRIEAIDISNLGSSQPVGSLVVLSEGRIDTSLYRRFKIRSIPLQNDVAMIAQVVRRRFAHREWGRPDLLVIDGGKTQLKAAAESLAQAKVAVAVIGLAKRFEDIIVAQADDFVVIRLPRTSPAVHVLQRVRDEAHRFALSYQKRLRRQDIT